MSKIPPLKKNNTLKENIQKYNHFVSYFTFYNYICKI